MSNTSCHLGRLCTCSGRRQAARRLAIASSSQRSGRNSRQSSGQEACSVTALTDTPSWQLAVLPSVPEYWRCTPTEHEPSLGKPVSSTTHAVGESAPTSRSASRSRIGTWQRREQVVGEGLQASADRGQLGWCEATHSLLPCAGTGRDGVPYTL